jgi:Ser/Thr protein kinase RdoA (MazF antagonist)
MSRAIYSLNTAGQKRFASQQFIATPMALRTLLRSYAFEPIQVAATTQGVENQTYMIQAADRGYVLRVYRQGKKTTPMIQGEIDFMEFLGAREIPVPQVVPNKWGRSVSETLIDGISWQFIVMRRMPGEHPLTFPKPLLVELAQLHGRLHLLGMEYAQTKSAHTRRLMGFTQRLNKSRWSAMGFSHFDITPYNLLVMNGHITGLLDFDDMNYGLLADCLAITLLRSSDIVADPANRRAYLTEYQKIRPLARWEQQRIHRHLLFHRRPFSVALLLTSRSRRKADI